MWSISEVKEKGKQAFKANYWLCVAVSFVMMMVSGAQGSSSRLSQDDTDKISDAIDSGSIGDALASLDINWGLVIGVIISIIAVAVVCGILIEIFIKNVVVLGSYKFFLNNSDGNANFSDIIYGFKNF